MNSIELKERLEKAEAKVEKCKATIERHKLQAEKKLALINSKGISEDPFNNRDNNDNYWLCCEYKNKLEDIESATKKLAEAEAIVENWRAKLDKQLAVELAIATEVPEAFREAKAHLVKAWTEYDISNRDKMLAKRRELDYKEFRKLYTYSAEEDLKHTDEEFTKINERQADYWLLDLYNRVKAITGEVTDCSYITWGGKSLDGYIVGKDGIADVETIGAGGYNIQRFHLRVLVKKRG